MKRVLIVSPHFPPTNAADMQRVRMVLPFLGENGWEAEVLAVRPEAVAAPRDAWLEEGLPDDVPVHRVKALGLGWSIVPGLGSLGWRAWPAVRSTGDALFRSKKFDLVYFSTTQWPVHLAGPHWKKMHGVPFAMDYQDPWINDYYREHPEVIPPGGRLRHGISNRVSRKCEPRVLRQCCGYTAVSPAYPLQLQRRYAWADAIPSLVLPFPGPRRDFERIRAHPVGQRRYDPADGRRHWVYAGRGGQDMETAARTLFAALRDEVRMQPALAGTLKLHFIGTSYAGPGRGSATIAPLAEEYGLRGMVEEVTDRIPYNEALQCLLDASAILVLGSDDASYTASKIYPCLLAKKPLLVICGEDSTIPGLMEKVGGGVCVTFGRSGKESRGNAALKKFVISDDAGGQAKPLQEGEFQQFTDQGSARSLCDWWNKIAAPDPRGGVAGL